MGPLPLFALGCAAILGAAAPRLPAVAAASAVASSRRAPEPAPTKTEGVRGTAVTMDGVAFNPERLIVKVGDTITWTNKDPYPHNVVSSTGAFQSEEIPPDGQWQFRATAAGRYPYTCTRHPGMDGILIVEP